MACGCFAGVHAWCHDNGLRMMRAGEVRDVSACLTQGHRPAVGSVGHNRHTGCRWCGRVMPVLVIMAMFGAGTANAAWQVNLPRGVTPVTHQIYELHMMIFWVCVAIGVLVFGLMFYSIIRHRKSRGDKAAQFHESAAVEITWTVIPVLILIAVVIPTANTLIAVEDSTDPDLTIKVTGYQWLWHYKYLHEGVSFFSRLSDASNRARILDSEISPYGVDHYLRSVDKRMVVPVDKKVRLLLTSQDVIHSWWVPKLAGKKDAIPGYINDLWFRALKTGIYRGQCAELCGRGHAYMPIVVQVVTPQTYQTWLTLMRKGRHDKVEALLHAAANGTRQGIARPEQVGAGK